MNSNNKCSKCKSCHKCGKDAPIANKQVHTFNLQKNSKPGQSNNFRQVTRGICSNCGVTRSKVSKFIKIT